MSDMTATIIPRSNQLNADDLLAGPRTITITRVAIDPGSEQPVAVHFEGDDGKPYMACKSMRRVMVAVWGPDAKEYAGRSMTLYRDPEVTWGGMAVGGIRISHMSHIAEPITLALTATKKARKPFRVLPLVVEAAPTDRAKEAADALIARFDAVPDAQALYALIDDATVQKQRAWLKEKRPEMWQDVEAAAKGAEMRVGEHQPREPQPKEQQA